MKKYLLFTALLLTPASLIQAQLIDIQFGGNSYHPATFSDLQTGAGLVGSAGDQWNNIAFSTSQYGGITDSLNLVDGTSSGATLLITSHSGSSDEYSTGSSVLPGTALANLYEGFLNVDSSAPYGYGTPTSGTFTFSGLTAGESYNLYVYSAPNSDRSSDWSLNGATPVQVGTNSGATALESPNNYLLLNGTANGLGVLSLTPTSVGGQEIDVNGFQLQAVAAPEPSTWALLVGGFISLLIIRRKCSSAV